MKSVRHEIRQFQALIVMLEHFKCDELIRALCRSWLKFDVKVALPPPPPGVALSCKNTIQD